MGGVVNFAILYAAWFASVLAAASGNGVVAALASLIAVLINLALSQHRLADLRLVAYAALVGATLEATIINLGLAHYASPGPIATLPPLWILSIWMAFATSLNVSLAWLKTRLKLAALLGAVGGPLSYYGGARLGGMSFSEPLYMSLGVLALLWAVAFPLLLRLAGREDLPPS